MNYSFKSLLQYYIRTNFIMRGLHALRATGVLVEFCEIIKIFRGSNSSYFLCFIQVRGHQFCLSVAMQLRTCLLHLMISCMIYFQSFA